MCTVQEPIGVMAGIEQTSRLRLGGVTALMLSDNQFSLELMSTMLTGLGVGQKYRCTESDGAIKILSNLHVDVVIVDCDGSGIDGPDFVRNWRAGKTSKSSDLPVIMITPAINAIELARVRDSGADGILAKPYAPASMLRWLGVLLYGRQRPSSASRARAG
jgi:CheY-like chemotaxis protein